MIGENQLEIINSLKIYIKVVESSLSTEFVTQSFSFFRSAIKYPKRGYILNTPKLQRLCMHDLNIHRGSSYFPLLFTNLTKLTHLDMSGCNHSGGMDKFKWLPKYLKETLIYLVLHNVAEIDATSIKSIITLKKLRHLDISKSLDKLDLDRFDRPNYLLRMIVEGLPVLSSLDISATNLAGNGIFEHEENVTDDSDQEKESNKMDKMETILTERKLDERGEMPKCDIVGLISRVYKPLDFLGLYKCVHDPNHRAHIPAKQVKYFDINIDT